MQKVNVKFLFVLNGFYSVGKFKHILEIEDVHKTKWPCLHGDIASKSRRFGCGIFGFCTSVAT